MEVDYSQSDDGRASPTESKHVIGCTRTTRSNAFASRQVSTWETSGKPIPSISGRHSVSVRHETAMRAGEIRGLLPRDIAGRMATIFDVTSKPLDMLFRKANARAGTEDATFHDSRHLAITRLARKLHVLDLARMVGHGDLKQLQVYCNATAEEMAKLLDGLIGARPWQAAESGLSQ